MRYKNRYLVFHSSFGYRYCDTLKQAREFVKFIESQCPQYCPSIWDTKEDCYVY